MRSRSGFTRVEPVVTLLVVGAFAALPLLMLAREALKPQELPATNTLRDTKCIANVKAIAMAIRMYAEEYEELWPGEQDERVLDYFNGGREHAMPHTGSQTRVANPYLRPAVILDRYVKSREVWRCPRAKLEKRAERIVPPGSDGDWARGYQEHQGEWEARGLAGADQPKPGPARDNPKGQSSGGAPGGTAGSGATAFPTGWSGFLQSIATNSNLAGLKLSRVNDAAKHLVCGDSGMAFEARDITSIAFPDTCATQACGYSSGDEECANMCNFADWEECPWTRSCGLTPAAHDRLLTDAKYRKTFTRHSGGSNVGFLDGHAKWYESSFLLTHSEPFKKPAFEGHLCSCWPGNGRVPKDAGNHLKHAKKPAAAKSRAKPTPQKKGR